MAADRKSGSAASFCATALPLNKFPSFEHLRAAWDRIQGAAFVAQLLGSLQVRCEATARHLWHETFLVWIQNFLPSCRSLQLQLSLLSKFHRSLPQAQSLRGERAKKRLTRRGRAGAMVWCGLIPRHAFITGKAHLFTARQRKANTWPSWTQFRRDINARRRRPSYPVSFSEHPASSRDEFPMSGPRFYA